MRIEIKRALQALTVLTLAFIFIGLGLWQLDRARELQNSKNVVVDTGIYPLSQLASATGSIPAASIGKSVEVSGHYMATYRAPNQKDGAGSIADWEVGLLERSDDTAILVVRGLWSDRFSNPDVVMSSKVDVVGTLLPKQNDDRAENSGGQLSRIDSALLVSNYQGQLYDGFILATSETVRGASLERPRISAPELQPAVPGYYWQHISYVVVWWFMALVVLWAPFYRRKQ